MAIVSSTCAQHAEIVSRLDELESAQLQVLSRLGAAPDEATGAEGSGMAGVLATIAQDIREIKAARARPAAVLRWIAAVLGVAVPLAAALTWCAAHLHFTK